MDLLKTSDIDSAHSIIKPLITKISDLVEQNQTIMRGLILIQKFIKASTPQQEAGSKSLFPE